MKINILLIVMLGLMTSMCPAQNRDSIPDPKVKRVFPAIALGTIYTGRWNGEAAFLLGLTNQSDKATTATSMIMHGPSLGCQLGKYNNAFRVAPKLSYQYYTSFLGGGISIVDYMDDDIHALYISPDIGISFGGFFNLFFGANLPVSDNKVADVKTFRFTASVNLLFFYFGKGK